MDGSHLLRVSSRGGLVVTLCGLLGACAVLNPAFMEDESSEGTASETGSASEVGTWTGGDTQASGDGDGDPEVPGDGDGEPGSAGDGDGDPDSAGDGDGDSVELVIDDSCPLDDSGLLACYAFNEPGELLDGSGRGNHGLAEIYALSEGLGSSALDCESSVAVRVPDSASLDTTDGLTMAMWVRPLSYPQSARSVWLDNSGQWGIMFDSQSGFVCRTLTTQGATQVGAEFELIPLAQWTHIACSFDGTTTRLYVDAQEVASAQTLGGTLNTANSEPMTIGSNSPSYDEPCSGQIDALHIYKYALSAAQLAELASLDVDP